MYKNELNKVKSKLGHLKAIHSVKKDPQYIKSVWLHIM